MQNSKESTPLVTRRALEKEDDSMISSPTRASARHGGDAKNSSFERTNRNLRKRATENGNSISAHIMENKAIATTQSPSKPAPAKKSDILTPKRKRRRRRSRPIMLETPNTLQSTDSSTTEDIKGDPNESIFQKTPNSSPESSFVSAKETSQNIVKKNDESMSGIISSKQDELPIRKSVQRDGGVTKSAINESISSEKESKEKKDVNLGLLPSESDNLTSNEDATISSKASKVTEGTGLGGSNKDALDNCLPIASIKSPSGASVDSAKGSSIGTELDCTLFSTGDLYWGRIRHFTYWACMVCPDDKDDEDDENPLTRLVDQQVEVHVRFFADNARHSWVKRENMILYQGLECYREHLKEHKEKFGARSLKYQSLLPKKAKLKTWLEAVKEADIISNTPYPQRLKKFFELNEAARDRNREERMRRKSMSIARSSKSEVSEFNTENSSRQPPSKRNRSESPISPAFSPIRTTKRRKTTADASELTQVGNAENSISQSTPHTSLSITRSNSFDNSNGAIQVENVKAATIEFEDFHKIIRDFIMEGNVNETVEKNLLVAVKNIWALKCIIRHQMEKPLSFENQSIVSDSDGSGKPLKRLSVRLKEIQERQHTDSVKNTSEVNESQLNRSHVEQYRQNSTQKPRKSINRPIEEVIDDIFNLDSRYLFENMGRDPVCKYCFKPGVDLKRCSKGCLSWLHSKCLSKKTNEDASLKSSKVRKRSIKSQNSTDSSRLMNAIEAAITTPNLHPIRQHVTADTDPDQEPAFHTNEELAEQTGLSAPLTFIEQIVCKECAENEKPQCFVCQSNIKYLSVSNGAESTEEEVVVCNMSYCPRAFHPSCLKYWPQAKIVKSKNAIVSLRCPSHVCHTCVSDDPIGKFQHLNNASTVKCVKCPATYHMDSTCIPAGSDVLTAAHIICPRHVTKFEANLNVNWCFICVRGGKLICCETCPTAVHAECLNIPIDSNEGYICEECESGRLPLYGEMVWAKFNVFRWWPAIILPPTEVPLNMRNKPHESFEFVIRFFGTHDHGWISRRRVYLYLEGDDYSQAPRSKRVIDQSYSRGVTEAKEAYEIIKAKNLVRISENESKGKLHPQPYVKIRVNRAVPPVKLHPNLEKVGKCDCKPDDECPCGPDTNCLNRVLYHECNPKICPAGERCQNQMFESRVSPALEIFYAKSGRGFGLRCREPISAGTFVIEYVGEVINGDEFQRRMQQKSIDRDENYYFLYVTKDYIIDAGPKGNMARFMNHSCDPNCETQKWSVNGLSRVGLFAIRDIPADTELTFNYHWGELLGNAKKACYCGSQKCTGQIGKISKDIKAKQQINSTEDLDDETVSHSQASKQQQKRRKNDSAKTTHKQDRKSESQMVPKQPKIKTRNRQVAGAVSVADVEDQSGQLNDKNNNV